MKHTSLLFVSGLLLTAAAGCASNDEPGKNEPEGPTVVQAPEFPNGTGQPASAMDEVGYPAETGFAIGSVIPNFKFIGYANYKHPEAGNQLQQVTLSDFYNPTGDGVFPDGSIYGAGLAKPKALVVLISSVWCGPCNQEAAQVLPVEYPTYKPMGGHFISVMIDGPTPGDPAKIQHITNWANSYLSSWAANDGTVYSLVMDPAEKVMPMYEPAFPSNLIVRTSDMRIMYRHTGVAQPGGVFWQTFEGVLDGSITDPAQQL